MTSCILLHGHAIIIIEWHQSSALTVSANSVVVDASFSLVLRKAKQHQQLSSFVSNTTVLLLKRPRITYPREDRRQCVSWLALATVSVQSIVTDNK